MPFHYFFLTYSVCGLLFPDFKVEFFLSFGFCPKFHPVVCVSFLWSECVLSFCLFVFPLMGKAEWSGNPVCWWFGFYFCFVCCLDEVPGKPRAPPNESQSHLFLSDILWPHGLVLRARFLEWVAFSLLQGFTGGSEEKYLPAMWETWVQSLGQQDPLEKEMATHSNALAWEIP